MANQNLNGDQLPVDPQGNAPSKPSVRTKRRLILKIVGGVLAALILLVLAAPTLLSTRPVLSIILGRVNDKLNGHVEVASLSLGWFTGINLEGVRVFDSSNSQIAQLDHLVVPLPLWKAITGNLAIGNVVCQGLSVDARYDAQHQLNFSRLMKPTPATPAGTPTPSTPTATVESRPRKLPDLSGSVKLVDCRATISEPGKPVVFIGNINGLLSIPNINAAITDSLDLSMHTSTGQEGLLNISGSVAAVKANQLALDRAEIHQKVSLNNLDLQTVLPFIPDSVGVELLRGAVGVQIAVDVTAGKNAAIDAAITGSKPIAIGGKVLKGDTFKTDTLVAAIPKLSAVFPDGLDDWKTGRITVGAVAGQSPILLKVDQGQLTVVADLLPQAILNLMQNEKPGSAGRLLVDSTFDVARIVPQLRNTLGMPTRILLQSGAFTEKLALTTTAAAADFSNTLDSTPLLGMDVPPGGPSKPITIDPIHIAIRTEDHGGGGAIPDLRSVNLTIGSKSINGQFQGASLADLNGTLAANLTAAMDEAKQFLPESKLTVAGNLDVKIGETGNLEQAPYRSALALNVTGHDLHYSSDGITTASEPMLQINLAADVQGSAAGSIESMSKLLVTLNTSRIQAPITVAVSNAKLATAAKSMLDQLQSAHLQIDVPDLKALSEEERAFSPPVAAAKPAATDSKAPPPVQVAGGSFSVTGDVSHDASGLRINLDNIAGRNIAFSQGAAVYPAGPVDLKLLIAIQTQAGESIAKQLANINAKLTGNLAQLSQLYAASGGEKPDAYPYRGDLSANENVGLHANMITLTGSAQVAKFQSYNGSTITFSEDLLALGNDVALATSTDDEALAIHALTVSMQSSGALNLAVKNGTIHHLQSTRDMQLQPTMDYDLAKLWPIVQPMMGDEYKTLKITGQFKRQFNIAGSYPAGQPSTVAIKTLHADGDLSVATFDYDGLTLQNFIVPFTLDNGKLVTVYAGKPAGQNTAAAATANGGTLDLGDLTIDLTQSPPRLTAPGNKLLISKLTVTPLFAKTFLADYLNNPIFAGDGGSGLLDFTLVDCEALPLGELVTQAIPANSGKVDAKISLSNFHIGMNGIKQLSSTMKEDSFVANVKDGTISVAKGLSTEHITFVTSKYSLAFDGVVRLSDRRGVPLNITFSPLALVVERAGVHDKNVLSFVPDKLSAVLNGPANKVTSYSLDIPKIIRDAGVKAAASGLLGGDKNNGGKNPLGGLLKGLEKQK